MTLLESELLSYLLDEKMKEVMPKVKEQAFEEAVELVQKQAFERVHQELEQKFRLKKDLQQTLIESLMNRFSKVPAPLMRDIWNVHQSEKLQHLIVEMAGATDLEEFTQSVKQVVEAA